MTTIAYNYRDGEIAVDSRVTKGNFISTDDVNKINIIPDGFLILSGTVRDVEDTVNQWPDVKLKGSGAHGFFVSKSGTVKWVSFEGDGPINVADNDWSDTAGSGGDHAITAMDMGVSAADAVKMAMKRDPFTGGTIRVLNIKSGEITVE